MELVYALLAVAILGRLVALLQKHFDWFEDLICKLLFWPWEPK